MTGTTGGLAALPEPELQPDVPSAITQIAAIARPDLGRVEILLGAEQFFVFILRSIAAAFRSQCRLSSHPSSLLVGMQLRRSEFDSVLDHRADGDPFIPRKALLAQYIVR